MSLTINSVSVNPNPATPGSTITATAQVSSTDYTGDIGGSQAFTAAVAASDALQGSLVSAPFSYTVEGPAPAADPVTGSVESDTGNRSWVLVSSTEDSFDSANGSSTWTLVFTTTA